MDDYSQELEGMLDTIRSYGFSDDAVLDAMRRVPRHMFLPEELRGHAYGDHPVPTGHDQTISQPYTVAFMLEALELNKGLSVLEIGAGSGWNAALIKQIVGDGKVIAIEYVPELADLAENNLKKAGLEVKVISGDGSLGYEKEAPFDRIIVTCACPDIPAPLKEQLMDGGIIIAPVGKVVQNMIKSKKTRNQFDVQSLGQFSFVPLKGRYGF